MQGRSCWLVLNPESTCKGPGPAWALRSALRSSGALPAHGLGVGLSMTESRGDDPWCTQIPDTLLG